MAYQGEDIEFDIKLWEDQEKTTLVDIDSLLDLLIYVYTTGSYTAKFSKIPKVGFNPLTRIDATHYRCTIISDLSKKLMPGQMIVEVQIVKSGGVDGRDNKIGIGYGGAIKPAKSSEIT